MSDDKSPIETAVDQAMDAFVYAPIGLVFDGPALFPRLVEKGRNQVQVARMMGKMAVQMGQSEAEKRLSSVEGPLRDVFSAMGVVAPHEEDAPAPQPAPTVASTTSTKSSATRAASASARTSAEKPAKTAAKRPSAKTAPAKKTPAKKTPAKKTPAKKTATVRVTTAVAAPSVAALAIPDYDSLSASQVVKRLRGMGVSDLEAVKAYENATRARKTILNRITQIQKG